MELREEQNGWSLSLDNGVVQLIQIDFRLGLFVSDASGKAQIYIEQRFWLRGPDCDAVVMPSEPATLAPVLRLFNAEVTGAAIQKTGQLKIQFGDDWSLEVEPNASYEAWQLSASLGVMLVCSPGGTVSVFRQPEHPEKAK